MVKVLSMVKVFSLIVMLIVGLSAFMQQLAPTEQVREIKSEALTGSVQIVTRFANESDTLPFAWYQETGEQVTYLVVDFKLVMEGSEATISPVKVEVFLFQDGAEVAEWGESATLDENYSWSGGSTWKVKLPGEWGDEGSVEIPYSLVVWIHYDVEGGEHYDDDLREDFTVRLTYRSGVIRVTISRDVQAFSGVKIPLGFGELVDSVLIYADVYGWKAVIGVVIAVLAILLI